MTRIAADANILVRAITEDHPQQSRAAQAALRNADVVAISVPSLCELVWVLSQGYKIPLRDIADTIRLLLSSDNVVVNRPMADAGLALLDAGGDFADGAIAYEGRWLGAETFLSFDEKAVKLIEAAGDAAQLLA